MLDDPLDDPGDTCQPEAAPSDLDTGSDLGNVSDDSDRPGSGNDEPEDSDPDAEDNVPDPQDHSLYHLYDIQCAMGSVIKFRLERGTWANLATETEDGIFLVFEATIWQYWLTIFSMEIEG